MKVLVLEKNTILLKSIKYELEKENFNVDCFTDSNTIIDILYDGYSCFILNMDFISSIEIDILKNIKGYLKNTPIIITSNNHQLDKIELAYNLGCNDYLKKPFFIFELIHKVKSLCKLNNKYLIFSSSCKYYIYESVLYNDGDKTILTKKELLFLERFVFNPHKIVTYEELEIYVWEGKETTLINIRALIKRLRKKLPVNSINIVRGIGYTLGRNVILA
jgi:DNA-binding response OmpR family regulator